MGKLYHAWSDGEQISFKYAAFFDGKGNEMFHRQLDLEMISELLPCVTAYLDALKQRGEIHVTDTEATAGFLLNGQIGIINDKQRTREARFELIRELILKVIQ